ncbi:MAG: hypothetical protein M0R06_03160 [Sphaerochaeta sp.]|jgi:hypothetical protein|nr:hypothetical protein [Sphaerochaeta sp.]
MPRFKIETSLFEPVTIEVEGGRTFESVPLSPSLIRAMQDLEDRGKKGPADGMAVITQQVALIFGVDVSEVEKVDVRILQKILTYATEAMSSSSGKPASLETMTVDKAVSETKVVPISEAQAEKNVPTPGPETSQ